MQKTATLLLSALVVLSACKKNNKEDFDRGAMLTDMANLVIVPGYTALDNSLTLLESDAAAFIAGPDATTLAELRAQYLLANKDFQNCAMYDFGPAKTLLIKPTFNTFPCDSAQIEANIAAGSYDLAQAGQYTAIGFPAIDYLLYFGTEAEILAKFTTSPNAANRKAYLSVLTTKMKTDFSSVMSAWNGESKTSFIASTNTDFGSSCSYLVNELCIDLEILKNAGFGIPSGELTGGVLYPEMVEAYYSASSVEFSKNHIAGLKNCFTGGTGLGFDDYIRHVENGKEKKSLADDIIRQFDLCTTKLNALPGSLSAAINNNPTAVNEIYREIQRLVVYLKTDMASMLGILLTYQDNDGD